MINLCRECSIRPVCIMFAEFSKYSSYASIELKTCDFWQWIGKKYERNSIKPRTVIDPSTGKSKNNREKIHELSEENRMQKENAIKQFLATQPKPKFSMEAKPLKLDYTCKGCNATTFAEDKANCAECGADICSCCATTNGDNGKLLCPKCWAEL